jgi:hypothetical protein
MRTIRIEIEAMTRIQYANPFLRQGYVEVAEWLRRFAANEMGSAREGSNPFLDAIVHPFF